MNLTREEMLCAAEFLESIAKNNKLLKDERLGICYNMENVLSLPIKTVEEIISLSDEWPEFSGDIEYPVPSLNRKGPKWGFHYQDVWNRRTKYGQSRVRLCVFLAGRLRELAK
jgi:hypothetical protein